MTFDISRRRFIRNTAIIGAGLTISKEAFASEIMKNDPIPLRVLDLENYSFITSGVTFGTPWAKGSLPQLKDFSLSNGDEKVSLQSWPLAYWPDGSLKWTAHAGILKANASANYVLEHGKTVSRNKISISRNDTSILVNNGYAEFEFPRSGNNVIGYIKRNGYEIVRGGRLLVETVDDVDGASHTKKSLFESLIHNVTIEQEGNIRVVIKVEGTHADDHRQWLPFTLRFYIYEGLPDMQLKHTIVYDGDEHKDFIHALGLQWDVALKSASYNRFIRFVGESNGVFAEAIQGLTGLRRDPGEEVRKRQLEGQLVDVAIMGANVQKGLQYIPAFGDYTLTQSTADGFEIKKRTASGCGWIQAGHGRRANGSVYLGDAQFGGIVAGIKNFWQSYPAQVDISAAHTSDTKLTQWLWAPNATPMDLRFYHDGLGENDYPKQRDALDITYEDYEPEFGRPTGVARTSELFLAILDQTPSTHELVGWSLQNQYPLHLLPTSEYLASVSAFGDNWKPRANAGTKLQSNIEQQLDVYFDYYQRQVEERHWYGYWNYGDFMHTYDTERHTWRYDVGGFAWDNSELSTDLWLWYYFLHSGRKEVFYLAEAMTRHTGEVDVHHIGPFSPLGSRHNVLHWGDSAKQLRISTATNRRFLYYLTADERTGDLLEEQVDAYKTLLKIAPGRKLAKDNIQRESEDAYRANIGFGTDWGAVAAAWFTQWERKQDQNARDRLLQSMRTIAAQPRGFFTGGAPMDIRTGAFAIAQSNDTVVSHLSASFGLPEILAEILIYLPDEKKFREAWLQYCRLYNASPDEQRKEIGTGLPKLNLRQGHSRLTAFAAKSLNDTQLAKRAVAEFVAGGNGINGFHFNPTVVDRPHVLNPVSEMEEISTNAVALWGLSALQLLAYVLSGVKHRHGY